MIPLPVAQVRDVELLVRAHHGIIAIACEDAPRAAAVFEQTADRLRMKDFVWREGRGLMLREVGSAPIFGTETLAGCLRHIQGITAEALYELEGIESYFSDNGAVALLRAVAESFMHRPSCLVFSAPRPELPAPLRPYAATLRLLEPTPREYYEYIRAVVADVGRRTELNLNVRRGDLRRLIREVRGLTFLEVRKLVSCALLSDGNLTPDVFTRIQQAKRSVIEQTGVLEYFPRSEQLDDVAGLEHLKRWLHVRAAAFESPDSATAYGLSSPRGILLLGVPGCGKSACAKAVASLWQLPLLRFDPARIFNRYVGQTEQNLADALRVAERVAPVVLWIDEIEKVFTQGGEDGGVSTRVLGAFLSWMQERQQPVFVIATANDISRLPPEFLRKGRFDEIFFVDLPDEATRKEILDVHLGRRGRDPRAFETGTLARATQGFSGAEIEQAIVSALYDCYAVGTELSTEALLKELGQTRPLSVALGHKLEGMRAWAREHAVPAG